MMESHIALAWLVASISYIIYCLFIKYCNNSNSFPPRVGSGNDSNSINGYNANWMSFIDLKNKNLSWSTIRVHVDPEYETILACEHGYYFEGGAEFQNIWEFVDFVILFHKLVSNKGSREEGLSHMITETKIRWGVYHIRFHHDTQ